MNMNEIYTKDFAATMTDSILGVKICVKYVTSFVIFPKQVRRTLMRSR